MRVRALQWAPGSRRNLPSRYLGNKGARRAKAPLESSKLRRRHRLTRDKEASQWEHTERDDERERSQLPEAFGPFRIGNLRATLWEQFRTRKGTHARATKKQGTLARSRERPQTRGRERTEMRAPLSGRASSEMRRLHAFEAHAAMFPCVLDDSPSGIESEACGPALPRPVGPKNLCLPVPRRSDTLRGPVCA